MPKKAAKKKTAKKSASKRSKKKSGSNGSKRKPAGKRSKRKSRSNGSKKKSIRKSARKGSRKINRGSRTEDKKKCLQYKGNSNECRSNNCWYNYDNGDCIPRMTRSEVSRLKKN